MRTLRDRHLLALTSEEADRQSVVECAEALAASGHARLHILELASRLNRNFARRGFLEDGGVRGPGESSLEAAKRLAMEERAAMFVAGWPAEPDPQGLLRFVSALNAPGVFVRWSSSVAVDRVLIPASGGPNALKQLWVAKEIASQWGIPARVLYVTQESPSGREGWAGVSGGTVLAEVQARAVGISEPIEVCVAQDVVSGICSAARVNDLIAVGAPAYWRMARTFAGSIPDILARRVSNPLLMLVGRKAAHIRLRDVFWPRMIRLDLAFGSKEDAIAALIETLVAHNQVPRAWHALLLERAIARERLMSTGVGSETAFPHIAVEDFAGVAGCMGIIPGGVDFDNGRGRNTRFVFLLVTPQDSYDEYLVVLSKIAERMVVPSVRQKLLACQTAGDVLNVLEPDRCGPLASDECSDEYAVLRVNSRECGPW